MEVYRHPRVLGMLFFGFSAGLPLLLVFSTLSAWLTEAGVSRTETGFVSWIAITYSIKFFWAPVVDRVPLPLLTRWLGQRRSWMLLSQVAIAAGLVGMASTQPGESLAPLVAFGVFVAFASATQDITIDAYRIEAVDEDRQAAMAATYIFGYRLALLVAGAGALYLAEFGSWAVAYQSMALCMAVGVLATLAVDEPERGALPVLEGRGFVRLQRWFAAAVAGPFRDFFSRNGVGVACVLLALIATYRMSDITMGVMANPFYLDLGFSKAEIASVAKIFGFAMTMVGSAVGGVLVVRYGVMRVLLLGACLVAATNLLFAALASASADLVGVPALAVVISADNFSGGLANVVFIAFLSGLTNRAYTATQYALFSSLMTLLGKFVGGYAGVVVDGFGYTPFFLYAAALGLPAIVLVLAVNRIRGLAVTAPTGRS